ncbi:MAG TPA: hypothetical protein VIM11_18585, partial [Tepidisphaeraceae bacterium]
LYAHYKLWEQMPADMAAAELRRTLGETVERQRDAARADLVRGDWVGAPVRWLLTIGAIIWFPFAQPILEKVLAAAAANPSSWNLLSWGWTQVLEMAVAVMGVNYLLKSVGFLAIYFVVLWLALRWNTQRKVGRVIAKWRDIESTGDPALNLYSQTLQWLDAMASPARQARQRMESLARRAEAAAKSLTRAA